MHAVRKEETLMARFVVISGPSCVGKSPLHKALARFHPDVAGRLLRLCLYNSRPPRPGETDGEDYHFRPREQVEEFRGQDGYLVMDVRGDLQALDLAELEETLEAGDALFEGNPYVAEALLDGPLPEGVERLSVFLSPLSMEELEYLAAPDRNVPLADLVTDVMRRKLLHRTRKQKGALSLPDLEEIERRAGSAYAELRRACRFDYVIPNPDGEDSDNWDAFYYPLGAARRAMLAVADLLDGREPPIAEHWPADLLPDL